MIIAFAKTLAASISLLPSEQKDQQALQRRASGGLSEAA